MVLRIAVIKKCLKAVPAKTFPHPRRKPLEAHPYRRYIQKNFRRINKPNENPSIALSKLRLIYRKFPEVRRRYTRLASKDKETLHTIQARAKNHRINSYSLYLKEKFQPVYESLRSSKSHSKQLKLVWKRLSSDWKALSSTQKEKYAQRAKTMHLKAKEYIQNIGQ
ncbi:High mobility group box domain containing protein [Perkinsela sp. CCAP 1560/4]|nr:High mobility group box domain containing protein [Perkinsela sp. CCAP 1560/4]|eukprot:KNH05114.1 High mobility group box domain containing protein [Perkinsela sp. CCAP 1560/4]